MIDNTNRIAELCQFNPEKSYYKFVCLVRWKDFKNNPDKMVLKAKKNKKSWSSNG